jgi:hypothetical protein
VGGAAFSAKQSILVGPNGTAAGDRGGYQPQCDRRTLAWAGADRRTSDADRRQPVPRPALVERSGHASQSPTDSPADLEHAPGQVMHTLYVAAHGTVVALGAYAADLQGQVETAKRRRQPIAERPTALEISAAQGMIARFDGFEHLAAAAYLTGATPPSSMNSVQSETPTKRLETALATWEVQAHRTLAASPDLADLVRVARVQALITSTTSILTEAAATKGHIDADMLQRLAPALEASQVRDGTGAVCRSQGRQRIAVGLRGIVAVHTAGPWTTAIASHARVVPMAIA